MQLHLRSIPGGDDTWALPYAETDRIVLKPNAPQVQVKYSSVAWDGGDRCPATSNQVLVSAPIPADYLVPNSGFNNSAAILAADGRTLINIQPFTRCQNGGIATSLVRRADVDLYGDGIVGAHGGSGMSSVGGTLRLGELRPGQTGPRHALKMTMYMKEAFHCTTDANCFRWPAKNADSYAVGFYGTAPNNPDAATSAFKMGALLAIPASVNLATANFKTEPARQIAWTLQNYGAYVVDDAYGPAFMIATEDGPDGEFIDQFHADYGVDFNQQSNSDEDWASDIRKLLPMLAVVDNNGPNSIGGGGTPRQPLAPAIAP